MMTQGKTLENVFYRDNLSRHIVFMVMCNVSGQCEDNACLL